MAAANRLMMVVRTYGGFAARVVMLIAAAQTDPSGAAVQAIRAALEAIAKLQTTSASTTQTGNYSSTSAAGAYEDDQDKASLTFLDAVGKYHSFRVPAPNPAIFQSGGNLVDLNNAAVQAFASYVITNFRSKTGAAFTSLVRGRRIRIKAGGRY